MSRFELGDVVRDEITGFEGVLVAITRWINNCDRLTLQPRVGKDGKVPEAHSIDEPNGVLVKAGPNHRPVKTGGPRPEPNQRSLR